MPSLKQTVTATTKHEVKLSPKLKTKLVQKLHTYATLKKDRDALNIKLNGKRNKKTKKIEVVGIQQEVEEILEQVDEASLAVDGFRMTIIAPVVKGKFNPKKAVALGISMEKIEQCYDEDEPGTSYVKITVPKAPGAEEDDE